jgi:Rps23 Pro-64 3,4-dihydroxylase Tpa1-like proline 4-hydroxylase
MSKEILKILRNTKKEQKELKKTYSSITKYDTSSGIQECQETIKDVELNIKHLKEVSDPSHIKLREELKQYFPESLLMDFSLKKLKRLKQIVDDDELNYDQKDAMLMMIGKE